MPKPGFTLGVLVLLLSLGLGVSIQAQPRETKPETATISGLVTLKGEPASGVTVLLQEQRASATTAPRARSDENGRFRFTGVTAGRYSISAVAPGYVSPGDGDMGRGGQTLNVTEGEKIENLSLDIRRGGVIAGTVTDSKGRPVVEEAVKLDKLDKNGKPQNYGFYNWTPEMYRTDDRGAYRIFGVPEGRYLVSVGNEQSFRRVSMTTDRVFYPRTFHPGVTSESEAKVVEVSEGSEATDVDIALPEPKRTCEISGRVVDGDTGQPVSGVNIVVGSTAPNGAIIGGWSDNATRSAANGEFRMTGVIPGKYTLLARSGGSYSPATSAETQTAGGFISELMVINVQGDLSGVEIKVRQGATISGIAVIEGTNDQKILSKLSEVNLYSTVVPWGLNPPAPGAVTKVNSDGSFHARGLEVGKVFFSIIGSPNAQSFVVARIEHNGAMMSEGIEVEAGQHLTGVRVVLVYGALKIRGELKVVGGALPAGFRLRAIARRINQQTQQSSFAADVDARGQFVIENVPPGEYEVRVFPSYTPSSEQLDRQILIPIASSKERVVVAADNPQQVVLVVDLSRKEGNR